MEHTTPAAMQHSVSEQTLSAWLMLMRAPGIGSITMQKLLAFFKTPQAIIAADRDTRQACGLLPAAALDYLDAPDRQAIDRDLQWLQQADCHILTWHDAHYPALLLEIPDPPPLLFVRGDLSCLNLPQLAIVGSRNPTPTGSETTLQFARQLAEMGLIVTSGLALGIDAAAHRGALMGGGQTIAVTGTGADRIYPSRHRHLAHEIVARGAVISEFPLGTPPLPQHFPRRNRIISGLSLGTLVTEATLRSGSLITAKLATDQGREVFAIPGSIHSPQARGCHELIRQGAKLVEEIYDIISELGCLLESQSFRQDVPPLESDSRQGREGQNQASLDQHHQMVLNMIGFDPTSMDALIERTRLTADTLSATLLTLELAGQIAAVAGGCYIRLK